MPAAAEGAVPRWLKGCGLVPCDVGAILGLLQPMVEMRRVGTAMHNARLVCCLHCQQLLGVMRKVSCQI